jgi:ABC-type lipoprotein release transport system permease subunit
MIRTLFAGPADLSRFGTGQSCRMGIVSRRTREIGIRSALGARQHELIRLVVGQGIGVALVGVALGIAAAFGVTRYYRYSSLRVHAA